MSDHKRGSNMADMMKGRGGRGRLTNNGQNFNGRQMRDAVKRKTIDHHSPFIRHLQDRLWQKDDADIPVIQPDEEYYIHLLPPSAQPSMTAQAVTMKFFHKAVTRSEVPKQRSPIFCVRWTPEGRRLVTGASSGQFTLWNGLTFNFETILTAHTAAVRSMTWNHQQTWMIAGDDSGMIRYWQNNMNNVADFQAHRSPINELTFSPTDNIIASASNDGTIRVFDFYSSNQLAVLEGHGGDVTTVQWHPRQSLIASGSRDNQQPLKLWDPRSSQSIATLRSHKDAVFSVSWHIDGDYLLSCSRDCLIKLFDLRALKDVQTFRGHRSEVDSISWHPIYHDMFASGGGDGDLFFWQIGHAHNLGHIEKAHDSNIWSLDWHPFGHVLATGSNDYSTKFWTRNRPGESKESALASDGRMQSSIYGKPKIPEPQAPSSTSFPSTSRSQYIPGLD